MSRLRDLSVEEMNEEQRRVYEEIVSGPRGRVRGPFPALLRCPEIAKAVGQLGGALRFRGSLSGRLREFAILITARFLGAVYEWHAHKPLAVKEGLDGAVISAIASQKRPGNMQRDEAVLYDFSTELHEKHSVGNSTYQAALDEFGEEGLVELVALLGHYTLVAMTLNAFDVQLPEGADPPFSG